MTSRLRASPAALALVLAVGFSAQAAGPRFEVDVEVVHASNAGSSVDPALEPMRDKFAKSGINYHSYHRLSDETRALVAGAPSRLALPNGSTVTLTLLGVDKGRARVALSVPPVKSVVELGGEGSVFVQAGAHEGGMLVLVLSPARR